MYRVFAALVLAWCCTWSSPALAANDLRTHTVYKGQRLASIAKRYRISVEALCTANGIRCSDPIRPGQKLVIPSRDDKDGSRAHAQRQKESEKSRRPSTSQRARNKNEPSGKLHTVARGQRLGSIAKRYRISVDALCNANGITPSDPIHPGQKLVVPSPDDKDGSRARASQGESPVSVEPRRADPPTVVDPPKKRAQPQGKPRVHKVYRGQRLLSIARRYRISLEALCHANDITPRSRIRAGQLLIIPARDDTGGELARKLFERGWLDRDTKARAALADSKQPWVPYLKRPQKRGHVSLRWWEERWNGYLVGRSGRLLPKGRRAITRMLSRGKDGRKIHPRLIQLIAQVSDAFGGRPIRIVSGFRVASYVRGSRHRQGRAVDFSIDGVPNRVLVQYLRTLENVGVGHYPNSSFVHLDVRNHNAYWVDYAGPGEAPRYRRPKRRSAKSLAATKAKEDGEKADAVEEPHEHSTPAPTTE